LEQHAVELVQGKTVLELGAGAGLPSLVCALNGAERVVVTDYPDAELIENLQYNIDHCELLPTPASIAAKGYLWGAPVKDILQHLPNIDESFDVLILADLLFNHSEHAKLIKSIELTLKRSPSSRAYVFFTPYRPWLLAKDLAFFDLAIEAGFAVEKTFEKVMDKVMFEEDPGVSCDRSLMLVALLIDIRTNFCGVLSTVMSSLGQNNATSDQSDAGQSPNVSRETTEHALCSCSRTTHAERLSRELIQKVDKNTVSFVAVKAPIIVSHRWVTPGASIARIRYPR
jgi:predicted nicotinamide N-methyase